MFCTLFKKYLFHNLSKTIGGNNIPMDESLFEKVNWIKIWIIDAKNNKTGNIRVDIFKTRTKNDIKIFTQNHIKQNNNIISDGWASYGLLDLGGSGYTHETFVHSPNENFGFSEHYTSQILKYIVNS